MMITSHFGARIFKMTRICFSISAFISIVIILTVLVVSCNNLKKEQTPVADENQEEPEENSSSKNETGTTVGNETTPLDTTIYNGEKNLWGWNNGDYIVLKWNRNDYSTFLVYKKTNKTSGWNPAWSESINRNEFFDRDIQGLGKIEYKVEAIDSEGQVLYSYEPLIFNTEN